MKRIGLYIVLLMISGCAALPPPSLSVADLSRYKLVSTEVEGTQIIGSWPAGEKEFLASTAGTAEIARRLDNEPASNFPVVQTYFKHALEKRLDSALKAAVGPAMLGQQPLVAVVKLKTFDIPSVGRRILIGGHANMKAQIDLVDARTRQVLITFPGELRQVPLIAGVLAPVAATVSQDDVADELIAMTAKDYRRWLLVRPSGTEFSF